MCALLQRSYPIISTLGASESEEDSDADTPLSATSDISEGEHAMGGTSLQADQEACQNSHGGM